MLRLASTLAVLFPAALAMTGCSASSSGRTYHDGPAVYVVRPLLELHRPVQLCGADRLFTRNTTFIYNQLLDTLDAMATQTGRPPLSLLERWPDPPSAPRDRERCLWNRFRLLLQVVYFDLYADLSGGAPVDEAFVDDVLRVRSDLLVRWLTASDRLRRAGVNTGFYEWEGRALRGMGPGRFLGLESEILPRMSALSRALLGPPDVFSGQTRASAMSQLKHILRMRTPLSSVAPLLALSRALDPATHASMRCLRDAIVDDLCAADLFTRARRCSDDDPRRALELLGLFSAQEVFLLRDWRAWIDANLPPADRARVVDVFSWGSEVYYAEPRVALRCGKEALYPSETARATPASSKAYHFYAMALYAYQLSQLGYPLDFAAAVPATVGRFYKRAAYAVGIMHNLTGGLPLDRGSTPDVDDVARLQHDGAQFGARLFRHARRAGREPAARLRARSVPLKLSGPWNDLAVRSLAWSDHHPGRLEVTLSEGAGPLRAPRTVTLQLTPAQSRALFSRGLLFPRVDVVDGRVELWF